MRFYQRRSVRVVALIIVLIAGLFALVHTGTVARFVADRIEASQGGRLRIGELSYRLWRRELTLRDVRWTQPGLDAEFPEIEVELTLARDELHVVRLPSPRIRVRDSATSSGEREAISIPAPPRARIVLTEGSLDVEAGSATIEATGIDVTFEPSRGTLRAAKLVYPSHEAASLDASFVIDGNSLRIEDATVDAYGGSLSLSGSLDFDDDQQSFEASFSEIDLALIDSRIGARASGRFEGKLERFDYRSLEGEGNVTLAPDPTGDVRFRVSDERLHFDSPGITSSRGVEASIEGSLTSALELDARFRARGRLDGLHEAVSGSIVAEGTLSGSLDAVRAHASVRSERLRVEGTPLDVDGRVSYLDGVLRTPSLNVAHASGVQATLSGDVSDVLNLSGRARYENAELGARVQASLNITGPIEAPVVAASVSSEAGEGRFTGTGRLETATRRIALSGEGTDMAITGIADVAGRLEDLRFEVEGTIDAPLIQGSALLSELSYRGVAIEETLVTAESDGKLATVEAGDLLTATTTLEAPYMTELTISLDALPLSELVSTFPRAAETQLSVSGEAIVNLPLDEPSSLRYRIEGRNALGVYRGIVLGTSAPFELDGDLSSIRIEELDLIGADTAVGLRGTVPLSSSGAVALDARGAFRLDILHLWFPEAELTGRANATVHIGGTLDELEWTGDAVIDDIGARIGEVGIEGGRVVLDGQRNPPQPVRIRIRAENVLAKSDALELEVSLTGDFASDDALLSNLEGEGRIEQLLARGGNLELASREPSAFRLADGLLSFDTLAFEREHTTLELTGSATPFGERFEWNAEVHGSVDHALFNTALSELGVTFVGTTDVDVRASNAKGELTVTGAGGFRDARLTVRDPPLVFSNVNGAFTMEGSTLRLESLTADAGGGEVEASGTVSLSGAELAEVNLAATATAVRLSYPEGLRSEIEGELRLTGNGERLRLAGDVGLNRAVFSRDIDVETELLRSVESVAGLTDPDTFAESVQLDIRVRADDGLRIDNNLARLDTTANLTLGGTLGTPELRGIVASRPGGRFRFGRNDYVVESARIQLSAYPAEPAAIEIEARTTVRDYDLRLTVSGTTDDLATEFSAPDELGLSQGDVASLLLTGRTLETVSSESRAVLGEQMASYLGSTLGDLAQMGLGSALPFQIVTVEPSLIAQEANPAARFTLGAALTSDLTMVYSIGLDDAENQIWIVDYELPRRIRAQLVRRQDNEFSLGATQKLQFDPNERGSARRRVTASTVSVRYLDDEPPESASEILRRLRPRPGGRWDYWEAWEHAESIRERLRAEGYLEASVDVVTESCGEGCVTLRYDVVLGVPVAFLWQGDPVDDSIREAVRSSWNGQLGEAFVATDIETVAEGGLFAKRYYLADVTASTQRTDHGVTVSVDFTTGPRGKRVALELDGNGAVPARVLRDALPERNSAAFYELLTTRRPRLKQLLELRYASFGYLTAEIGDPERHYDAETGTLTVRIPVSEGALFTTETVELQGAEAFEPAALRARLPLREGTAFRPADFVRSRGALASYYRQQGFPDVTVIASLVDGEETGKLGARFTVNEGRKATVGTITVAGNDSTRNDVVLRESALTEGETLRLADVNETQKRLYELGAFRSAEVVVSDPIDGDTRRDVMIRVREVPRLAFEYGLRLATDGLFQVDTEVGIGNLFGRAHHTSFRTLVATDQRILRLNYHMPYFVRYQLDTDFFVERELLIEGAEPLSSDPTQKSAPFTTRSWRFTAQQTKALASHLSLQWSYSFERAETTIEDPMLALPSVFEKDKAVVTGAIVGDQRDNLVRPTRGSLWSASIQLAPARLGSDSRFTKLFGQLYFYQPLGRGLVWASGYRLGFAENHGEDPDEPLSLDDGFRAGGPSSVRGFGADELGPARPGNLPFGGSALVIVNQEIRFPLVWRLRGAGFYDTGNAFADPADIKLSELRHSVGLGVRLELPVGVLRLDWARVLDPLPSENRSRFIFTLGHAF